MKAIEPFPVEGFKIEALLCTSRDEQPRHIWIFGQYLVHRRLSGELLHHGRRAGQEEMTEIQVVSGKTNLILHIETYQL